MIPPNERGSRFLMPLIVTPKHGFFDESGTHDQSDMVAVGGIIGSYEALARAELEWGRVLKRKGIEYFHFTDFMARESPYDWPKNEKGQGERDDFIERLATITLRDSYYRYSLWYCQG